MQFRAVTDEKLSILMSCQLEVTDGPLSDRSALAGQLRAK